MNPTIDLIPLAFAASAAAVIASASSTVLASGFSHRTCLPASRAAIAISAWLSPGVHTSISWMSSRPSSLRQSVSVSCQPSFVAAASTASALRPQSTFIAGSSGRSKKRGALRQACEWAAPMNA